MGVSDRAKHVGIPGSRSAGFAGDARPGMTMVAEHIGMPAHADGFAVRTALGHTSWWGMTSGTRCAHHTRAHRSTVVAVLLLELSLDKMRARDCRFKPIGEILRFVGHPSVAELHDAHRVRWYTVIGQDEFGDP
jgi:hypothetical protein